MNPMVMMALATLGSAAVGGILGKYQGDKDAKAFSKTREKDLKREVALTPWSPWGPLKPEKTINARPDPMNKAMQSAIAFGQMGQNAAMSNAWMNQNKRPPPNVAAASNLA